MKNIFFQPKLFLFAVIVIIGSGSFAQKQFVHTATRANNSCNGDCTTLDNPELNGNPDAIIFVTPVPGAAVKNDHRIGVYYFKKQWNIFNLDQVPIPPGAQFNVEYQSSASEKYFSYTISQQHLLNNGSAVIDHPALNNDPNAQFRHFLSWDPETKRGVANREAIKIEFNKEENKWMISNVNKKPMAVRVAYNFALSAGGNTSTTTQGTTNSLQASTNTSSSPSGKSISNNVQFMYLTSWINTQKVPGDNLRAAHLDKTELIGYELSVSTLSAAGTVSKLTPYYLTLKTYMGSRAETLIFDAFAKNQLTEHLIEAYTTDQLTGSETLCFSIKLTGAHVVGFKQSFDEFADINNAKHTKSQSKVSINEYQIKFTQIQITNSDGYSVTQQVR